MSTSSERKPSSSRARRSRRRAPSRPRGRRSARACRSRSRPRRSPSSTKWRDGLRADQAAGAGDDGDGHCAQSTRRACAVALRAADVCSPRMVAVIVSAVLVCAGALVLGQAVLRICGWQRWSWLAPAVGLVVQMLVAIVAAARAGPRRDDRGAARAARRRERDLDPARPRDAAADRRPAGGRPRRRAGGAAVRRHRSRRHARRLERTTTWRATCCGRELRVRGDRRRAPGPRALPARRARPRRDDRAGDRRAGRHRLRGRDGRDRGPARLDGARGARRPRRMAGPRRGRDRRRGAVPRRRLLRPGLVQGAHAGAVRPRRRRRPRRSRRPADAAAVGADRAARGGHGVGLQRPRAAVDRRRRSARRPPSR